MKKIFGAIAATLAFTAAAHAQSNPCVHESGTNCTTASGPPLALTQPDSVLPCGTNLSVTVEPTLGLGGLEQTWTTYEDCVVDITNYPLPTSSIISNWWTASTGTPSSGAGSNAVFASTSYGTGTLTFHLTYSNYCGGTSAVSQSFTYTVVKVASLAPTGNTNCTQIFSNATEQTYTIPVSTNPAVSNLEIVAASYPSGSMPACWSLNGQATKTTYIGITNPGVYTVICSIGESAVTNIIWVTENGDVEQGCPGTGSSLLGYWSFNQPSNSLIDWWSANSDSNNVVYDSIGANNGTFYSDQYSGYTGTNITYSTGSSGRGFYFDGNGSYISFNTNVGNFGTNDFTIDFWVEAQGSGSTPLVTKEPQCSGNYSLWGISLSGGQVGVSVWGTNGTYKVSFNSRAVINNGLYHEITLQRNGLNLTLYVDGNLDTTVTAPGIADLENSTPMMAANSPCLDGGLTSYPCVLAEIKFYNGVVDPWSGSAGPWVGSEGQQPLTDYGLQNPASPWGNALKVDTNVAANLSYRYMENDGSPNINCINGAVSFWFKPDWNGGVGPGNAGQFLEMGDVSSAGGWWSLGVDPTGSTLSFEAKSGPDDLAVIYITQPITNWSSNDWYQLVLNYSSNQTSLYINGVLAQTGSGVAIYPAISNRLEYGFSVGSDHNGTNQVRGTIDELYTFDCPLTAQEVAAGFPGYPGYPPTSTNPPALPMGAPWILTQPVSQTVSDGNSAVFSVTAVGSSPLGYQWKLDNSNIAGATNSSYVISDVQAPNAGSYEVVVTNAFGSATSIVATLSDVPSAPVFVYQPIAQTVVEGDTVTFSARAVGTEPISYQWQEYDTINGTGFTNLPGQTNSRWVDVNMQADDRGTYAVLASNALGTNFSTNGVLTDAWFNVPYPDYGTVMPVFGPRQDYTFQAGKTYYIGSGCATNFDLYGTTTIQGGAVIKFDDNNYIALGWYDFVSFATLVLHGPLVCQTGPYNPAILTSVDDDSQGELPFGWWIGEGATVTTDSASTATNGYAYLNLDDVHDTNATTISYLRFCYAGQAVTTPTNSGGLDIWNCQFVQCGTALNSWATNSPSTNRLHNDLFSLCDYVFAAQTNLAELDGEQVTADAGSFWNPMLAPGKICLTNSIVLGDFGNEPVMMNQDVTINPSSPQFELDNGEYYNESTNSGCLFEGTSGYYYLAKDSACCSNGTTNISALMLQELCRKTTQAPIHLPAGMIVQEMTLFPVAQRYRTGSPPNRGYYYDALDYTVASIGVSNQVTVLPGTAIGFRNDWFGGFFLMDRSSFAAQGMPTNPIVFADIEYVQEGPLQQGFVYQINPPFWAYMEWGCLYYYGGINFFAPQPGTNADSRAPAFNLRFCNMYLTADDFLMWGGALNDGWGMYFGCASSVYWNMQECSQHGGQIALSQPVDYTQQYVSGAVSWTNNLFDTVGIYVDPSYRGDEGGWTNAGFTNLDFQFYAYNNLFRNGFLTLLPIPTAEGDWTFRDNLFDQCNFAQDANQPFEADHNAYYTNGVAGFWPVLPPWMDSSYFAYPVSFAPELVCNDGSSPTGDLTLTSPPPYQTGPFGNYYMESGTVLAHAGSATVGQLGLYEYTTTTNQALEAATSMADIGLHYVAASNSPSGWVPLGSNPGEVPNYIADINGNDVFPTGATNPYSTIYTNVDLDGDGMVGLVETNLHKNPLVFDNPMTLTQTGYGLTTATFEVDVSNSLVQSIGQLVLMVDGVPNVASQAAPDGLSEFVWNTADNTNYAPGQTHYLQAHLILNGSGVTADGPLIAFNQPVVVIQPAAETNGVGGTVTFTASTAGPGPYTYQWYCGTNLISGATNSSYTITNLATTNSGTYTVVVTDADGNPISSANSVLTVENIPLFITSQPLSQQVMEGDTVTFAVTAGGTPPLVYQWQMFDSNSGSPTYNTWTNLPGATNTTFTMFNMQSWEAGGYCVVVSNSTTNLTSLPAILSPLELAPDWRPDLVTVSVVGPRQNYTFRGDTTYVIGSTYYGGSSVDLYGGTVIEGGTVIKFDNVTNASLIVHGTLTCKTGPYHPAILTSVDDFSQGEIPLMDYFDGDGGGTFPLGTGYPETALNYTAYLNLDDASDPGGTSLSYLRFCYADRAATTPTNSANLQVWNCQFYDCNSCLNSQRPSGCSTNGLHNVLFSFCNFALAARNTCMEVDAEQLTADVVSFWNPEFPPSKLCLTNAIVLGQFGSGPALSTQCVAINPSDVPFDPCGDGSYYLSDGSLCRNAGTNGISSAMLQQLRSKTTWAPTPLPGEVISSPTILSPTVPRYSGGSPDMGYYYDALDLTVGNVLVSSQVTVLPGTAIGIRNDFLGGFFLAGGSTFLSEGNPTNLITYADVALVQEGPLAPGYAYSWSFQYWWNAPLFEYGGIVFFAPYDNGSSSPALKMDFSQLYLTADDSVVQAATPPDGNWNCTLSPSSSLYWTMRDCAVQGGYITLGQPLDPNTTYPGGSVLWANNLFQYVQIELYPSYTAQDGNDSGPNVDMEVQTWNNLFRQGSLALEPITNSTGTNWLFTDNLFDQELFIQDTAQPLSYSNNDYWPLPASAYPNRGSHSMYIPVLPLSSIDQAQFATELYPTTTGDGTGDQTNTTPPIYETGFFGQFYQPASSPLLHAGSRTAAAAGLAAFTVLTNGAEEGTSTVSIGLHYVATNGSGVPCCGTNVLPDWWQYEYYGTVGVNPAGLDTNSDGYTALQKYQLGLDPGVAYGNPVIVEAPMNQQAYIGGTAVFNVMAGGTLPLSYQWYFNGNPVSGATGPSLAFSSVQLTNAGDYWVTVASTNGSVTSPLVTLAVLSDFMLAIQPSCAVDPGRSALFTVSSVVSAGTSYQWYFNGAAIPGATTNSYLLTNAQATNAGYYSVGVNQASPTNLVAYFGVLQGPPPPVANADIFTVRQNSGYNQLDILANDHVTVDSLTITNYTEPTHGAVSTDGHYIYYDSTVQPDYIGPDSFTYTVADGIGTTSTATVTVFISHDGSDNLQANDVSVILQTNVFTAQIDLSTNDWNPGTNISVYSPGTPSLGTVAVSGTAITYTRNTNLFGSDTFTYTITDTNGDWAQATITIGQTNAAGDGMPDQWKLLYGLSTAEDISTNDPDGDGLPNLAEYTLHTDPLVPDNPLNFANVQLPNPISGYIRIPLPQLSSNIDPTIVSFQLCADGLPLDAQFLRVDGHWYADWDTSTTPNGTYQINFLCFYDTAAVDTDLALNSVSVMVNINNPVTLSEDSIRYENQLNIQAQVNQPSQSYSIDVYDHVTGNYLTNLSGPVVANSISTSWDLGGQDLEHPLDITMGIAESEETPQPQPKPHPLPKPPRRKTIPKDKDKGIQNYYTVAAGWNTDQTYMNNLAFAMIKGAVNPLSNLAGYSAWNGYQVVPSGAGGNNPDSTAFIWWGWIQTLQLLIALQESDNFFFLGHGNVGCISPYTNGMAVGVALPVNMIAGCLGNTNTDYGFSTMYRLAILYSCRSYSPALCNAFGVEFSPNGSTSGVADYLILGKKPRAYVGWREYTEMPGPNSAAAVVPVLQPSLNALHASWMEGSPLVDCIDNFTDTLDWLGLNKMSTNGMPYVMESAISGCTDLNQAFR